MAFCNNCGAALPEGARFCGSCGAKVSESAPQQVMYGNFQSPPAAPFPPAPEAPAYAQPPQPAAQGGASMQPTVAGFDFSRIPVRHRCVNGHVTDGPENQTACPTCGAPHPVGGIIQIYRMGNFSGMAVGMGVYLNGQPYGHLGNKQSIRISVPYGQYLLHMTHTTTRACNDPVFNITPQTPYVCCKAHFAKAGFQIAIDPAAPETMPAE